MPFFSFHNTSIFYQIQGEGAPLLLTHGLGAHSGQPLEWAGSLPGWRLIAADMPGHGQSLLQGSAIEPGFEQYVEVVRALLDHLQIGQVLAGGISMGSGISLGLALRHPQRVKGLILHRPAWLHRPLPSNLAVLPLIADLIEEMGPGAGKAFFEQSGLFRQFANLSPGCGQSLLRQFSRPQAREAARVLWQLSMDAPFSSMEDLQQVQCPVLLMASTDDPLHPFEMGQRLAAALPHARFEQVISNYLDSALHKQQSRQQLHAFLSQLKAA
ncbi:MAG: alpha/beta hydrolase [Bacteroidetes bacterium]|nr:MAG: alpha/beta hydrolase [Bacteroidota bacterium]